ncbi:MAG: DUF4142 domain-containing protein [Porphyrobacter sp.]|nr:DUF4142 domain-containing protein [Porphyrobacter sp.]
MRIALLVASTLIVTACDNRADDTATAPADTMAADQTAADRMSVEAPDTAQAYVERAAISDMYEIEAGKLALDKAASPETRDFAQMMIDDHTATTRDLKDALGQMGDTAIVVPATLDNAHREMIDQLQAMEGEGFDRAYRDQQVTAHHKALALHQTYAERGDKPELQAFAKNAVPVIEKHLKALSEDLGAADAGSAMTPAAR